MLIDRFKMKKILSRHHKFDSRTKERLEKSVGHLGLPVGHSVGHLDQILQKWMQLVMSHNLSLQIKGFNNMGSNLFPKE